MNTENRNIRFTSTVICRIFLGIYLKICWWERTGDIAVVCTKTIISIFSITPAASSHNVTPVVKEACQA